MAASPPPASGRIFLSYRREESAYPTAWLYDRLADRFGDGQVFKDVDSIELGDDFVEVITTAVGSCDVLLAVVGPRWLDATDEDGRRRLDDPDDFVRLEIDAALARNVRVIPILVDDARMPRATDLPPSLVRLVRRQALELSPNRFQLDTSRLLRVLEKTLAEVRTAQAQTAGTAAALSTSELPAAPEQQEWAESRPTSSSSPAAPTVAATARLPSGSGQPPGDQHRRRFTWAWALAGAGVGAVLILVIVAIVARSDRTPSTAEGVLFRDDFSGQASGWEDAGSKPGGHYVDDAYRISVTPAAGDGAANRASFPTKARPVYPSAPSNLRIQVDGRRLPESNDDTGYGIQCRVDGENYYDFTITDNDATIAKSGTGIVREVLDRQIDANAMNRLQASCTNVEVEGQRSVYLVFSVDDQVVAEYTDKQNPYLTGTVGLTVWTDPAEHVQQSGVVQFDNFIVTHA
jgi:hypothetical protein